MSKRLTALRVASTADEPPVEDTPAAESAAVEADPSDLGDQAAEALGTMELDPPARGSRATPTTDPELVRRARTGDVHAFEALYRQWHRRLYGFIYQMIGNETEATDLTQDTFVKLWEALPTLRAEEAFTSYLYRMAVNLCRDQYRRRGRAQIDSLDQPRFGEDDDNREWELPDTRFDPAQPLETRELQDRVQAAIAKLSPDHRTVIVLHHFQDLELIDIARVMGCAEGTVKSRLARAREELKRKLQGYLSWP